MPASRLQVVWYKRDLRVRDHQPLAEAVKRGPVLPLYVVEPSVLHADDFSAAHWSFLRVSLAELRERLATLGQPLVVRTGEVLDVFKNLYRIARPFHLWAHQETGNRLTHDRDIAVRRWTREHSVPFTEIPQHGVFRGLDDRDGWADRWEERMSAPLAPIPEALTPIPRITPGPLPTHDDLILTDRTRVIDVQRPGESAAQDTLQQFLTERGEPYFRSLSSPLTAFDHCSRLSPHLAWGTLSLREVVQRTRQRRAEVRALPPSQRDTWRRSLQAFESRLHWHCHFIQKLESAPRIEHESFIPAFDALREDTAGTHRLEAWVHGRTGYPMVDASMRALRATGYLNFRMRAMVVSFAAYDLWLDWRRLHPFLARHWVDYEPGIHLCQLQMQSGTTGINALRIYNPTKQGLDHDPDGIFIRRWVLELANVPLPYLHRPWLMPRSVQQQAGCRIGTDYPRPVVKHDAAAAQARARITAVRKRPEIQRQAAEVLDQHGSRARRARTFPLRPEKSGTKGTSSQQGRLGL